jgi:hypothetical protein
MEVSSCSGAGGVESAVNDRHLRAQEQDHSYATTNLSTGPVRVGFVKYWAGWRMKRKPLLAMLIQCSVKVLDKEL